jgi:hypothetical protein
LLVIFQRYDCCLASLLFIWFVEVSAKNQSILHHIGLVSELHKESKPDLWGNFIRALFALFDYV